MSRAFESTQPTRFDLAFPWPSTGPGCGTRIWSFDSDTAIHEDITCTYDRIVGLSVFCNEYVELYIDDLAARSVPDGPARHTWPLGSVYDEGRASRPHCP